MKEKRKKNDVPTKGSLKACEQMLKRDDPATGQENDCAATKEWRNAFTKDCVEELKCYMSIVNFSTKKLNVPW